MIWETPTKQCELPSACAVQRNQNNHYFTYSALSDHLRNALVIVKLKKAEMTGDYARVLHKLSGLLRNSNSEVEAIEKETEAVRIRMERSLGIQPSTITGGASERDHPGMTEESGEEPYDNLVYVLWR